MGNEGTREWLREELLLEILNLVPERKFGFCKLEWKQTGGSIKPRTAFQIINDAICRDEFGDELDKTIVIIVFSDDGS